MRPSLLIYTTLNPSVLSLKTMKSLLAVASAFLAAHCANAFLPTREHFEGIVVSLGQQTKLRVDFTALPSLPGLLKTTTDSSVEKQAPWGLARISHRDTLNFGTFNKYIFDADAGTGVDAYVIDSGVNLEHVDFEGRASWGKTIIGSSTDEDNTGSGTHLAGTIAGKKYGVAKRANIIAVKIIDSIDAIPSDVIDGVNWVIAAHQSKAQTADPNFKGSVMMLNVGQLTLNENFTTALDAAYDAGIHVAVSAGNDNSDACFWGASKTKGLTAGATGLDDSRVYFSNYGSCVDVFAPGLSIQSTWIGSRHAVNTISGSKHAAAHVAGLLAYLVSSAPQDQASPDTIKQNLLDMATKGALSDLPDSDTPNVRSKIVV